MRMRSVARRTRAVAYRWAGLSRRMRQRLDGSRAAVLLYHRILPGAAAERGGVEPGMYVTPESFGRHLDWLCEDFCILPLHEIVECLGRGQTLPRGACALTFDDGWRDNVEHALPELARRSVPATIFVVTARVGTDGAFWPDEVSRRLAPLSEAQRRSVADPFGVASGTDARTALLDVLKRIPESAREAALDRLRAATPAPADCGRELCDWDELARLSAAGVEVESHGATHAILTGLPQEAVDRELRASRKALRERGFGRHGLLAYPSGAHDRCVQRSAGDAGFRAAFTTEPGLLAGGVAPLALPRLALHEDVCATRAEFLFRIPGAA